MTEVFTPKPMPTAAEIAAEKEKRENRFLPNHGYFVATIAEAKINLAKVDKGETKVGDAIRTSAKGDKFINVGIKLTLSKPGKDAEGMAYMNINIGFRFGTEVDFLNGFCVPEKFHGDPTQWIKNSKPAIVRKQPEPIDEAWNPTGEYKGYATTKSKDGKKTYISDYISEILPFSKKMPIADDHEELETLYEEFFSTSKKRSVDTQPGFGDEGTQTTMADQAEEQRPTLASPEDFAPSSF